MKYLKKIMMLAMALAIVMTCLVPTAQATENTGTITLTNAAIGKDYEAYKILDATYSGENVAYTTKNPELFSGEGSPWEVQDTADASGNYSVKLADGKDMGDVNTWIDANLESFTAINPSSGVDSDAVTANKDTVTWDNLEYGYYYITSGLGAVVTVDSVKPAATVIDKNETAPQDPEKTSDSETAQIGDIVEFQVTFAATNYVTESTENDEGKVTATTEQITVYTVKDSANGFNYLIDDSHPVTVKVGSNASKTVTVTPVQQSSATEAGSIEFDISWVDDKGEPLYQYSENVTITYWGVVNAFAMDGEAKNEVSIAYNNEASYGSDSTETKTYNLTINKVDQDQNPLTGAKFELYRNAADGTKISLVDITTSVTAPADKTIYYRVAETGESGVTTIDLTEGSYSSAVIYGLDGADTYFVQEIEAPKGYNKLPGATQYVMNNANGTVTIENEAGVVLPSTGGMGTTLFYILGSVMVVGALVILVTNKRMGKQ